MSAQTWGDVYYFCGADLRFCTCDFRWNLAGWYRALTLWNFTLSSALGLQKLAIRVGLGGLLPGACARTHATPCDGELPSMQHLRGTDISSSTVGSPVHGALVT